MAAAEEEVTVISTRGQVVIPQEIRQKMKLKPKDRFIVFGKGDTIIMKKLELPELREAFSKIGELVKEHNKQQGRLAKSDMGEEAVRAGAHGMRDDIEKIRKEVTPVLKANQVKRAAIFGSVARGEARATSDVDFLIEFKKKRPTLFDMGGLKGELERKLKKSVDLVLFRSIDPRLRERILTERVDIL